MRRIIKLTIVSLICFAGGILFLVSQLRLEKERDRDIAVCAIPADLKKDVDGMCKEVNSVKEILAESSKLVCGRLSFAVKNNIACGEANCIGYAQLTSAVINYAFQVKKLPYKAKPVVGKVYLFGIDLNNVAQIILPEKHRSFFKDHDFVDVDLGDRIVFIDTSLQDLTGLSFMQIHNN